MSGVFTHNGNIVAGLPAIASQINYDNTDSGMAATQVQAAVDELKSDLTNNTISPLTAGDSVTIVDGGYTLIGKLVVVNVRINVTSSISGGSIILSGLPIPKSNGNNVVLVTVSNVNEYTNAFITTQGIVQNNTALTTGIKFINAIYITN